MNKKNELKAVPIKEFEKKVLKAKVESDTFLKKWLIQYVGEKCNPKDDIVTVEMVMQVFADEFPQALIAVAEENYLRGYKQAIVDFDREEMVEAFKEKSFNLGYNAAILEMGKERQRRYEEIVEQRKVSKHARQSKKSKKSKESK